MSSAESSFPTTQPAFNIKVDIDEKYMVGDVFTGSTLVTVPFFTGRIESVPGFEPALSFDVVHGADWFYIDADKGHARVNVKAIAKDADGVHISVNLTGVVTLNEHTMPFIMGDVNAKTGPFGNSIEMATFEVGDAKYKFLEQNLWAASQRFACDNGKYSTELRVSKIMAGKGSEYMGRKTEGGLLQPYDRMRGTLA